MLRDLLPHHGKNGKYRRFSEKGGDGVSAASLDQRVVYLHHNTDATLKMYDGFDQFLIDEKVEG